VTTLYTITLNTQQPSSNISNNNNQQEQTTINLQFGLKNIGVGGGSSGGQGERDTGRTGVGKREPPPPHLYFFIYWKVNTELVYHMCYIGLSYVLFAKCFSVTIFGLLA